MKQLKFGQLKSANKISEVSSLMRDLSEVIKQYSHIHHVEEVVKIKEAVDKLGDRASSTIDEWYRSR